VTGSVFPAFLKLEYQPSGSAKSSFLAEMASISTDAKRQFENAFGEIGKTITNSLSGFKGSNFKFDLNTSGLRQAAADADFALQKLQELQRAVSARMPSTNDPLYAETVKYAQALSAQVIEARKAKEVADAQVRSYSVLQAEIDKTSASNARLAESYRATFLEQAKTANAAFAYQQRLNASLGLTRTSESGFGFTPGRSARDSASVFESQSYAPRADTRSGLDRLMAGQASIDKAALSGATLENVLGRVSARGQEVAAALQQAERAAEALAATRLAENEAALARAAAEAKSYAAAAAQLRAQLDPTIAIQQRFDAELANADRLLAANAISQREYAQAVALAQNNLKESWATLTRSQEENIRVGKRGTTETQNVINGLRAQRVAGIQAGQQLQDMAVQFQMGTNASVIMAQQLPQLAFSLSGLENNANKTLSRIGAFATFLSGPWGAAIAIGLVALGPFIDELYRTLTAADDATEALQKFINKQREASTGSLEETQALIGLNKARSEMIELDLKLAKRPKGPDGTPLFSYKDLQRQKELRWEIVEAEGAIQAAEAKREMAAKSRTPTTRTQRTAGGRGSAGSGANFAGIEFGEDAAKRIDNIRDSFADIPPQIERINRASRELDDIISDLGNRKPLGFTDAVAEAQALKAALPDMVAGQIMRQITDEARQQFQIQNLISQGRDAEAAALQNIFRIEQTLGPLTAERRREMLGIADAEQRHIEALQRVQQMQAAYLDATRSIRGEVEAILGGYGKISNLKGIFQQLQGRVLTEQIFGDVFRDMDRWVKEKTGIGSSVDMMAQEVDRAGDAAGTFADRLVEATNTLAGAVSSSALGVASARGVESSWALGNLSAPKLLTAPQDAANDNQGIVVVANKPGRQTVNDLSPQQYFEKQSQNLAKPIIGAISDVLGPGLAKTLGGPLTGAIEGYLTTGTGFGAALGGLKDLKGLPDKLSAGLGKAFGGAQTGAQVAGIGNALGLGLSNTGSQIGGAIGSFIPIPGGDIIGSVVGGLIGKLFGKRPRGSGSVTQSGVTASANDGGIRDALDGFGTNLQGAIGRIADAFGAQVGNYSVGIGRYKDYFQVSSVANDPRLGGTYFQNRSSNALYDGKDPEEAMRAAILNALQDGAIKGIRDGSMRLLKAGKDLDAQIQKALDFENVFKRLKAFEDPVGAALDTLNAEFTKLKATFAEAGASAAEYAALEKLYGIERADAIKTANEQVLGSLKDLIKSLTIGNENRSLRDREAEALRAFTPLDARVKAGDTTAFSDFSQAAQDLLDIQRQLYGSQSQFFASEDAIKSVAQAAIDRAQQVSDAAANRDSPFKSGSAAAVNDNASVTSAIDRQTQAQRDIFNAVNDNLGTLVRQNRELAIAMQKSMANGTLRDNRGNF
jgi:hypothetical protein